MIGKVKHWLGIEGVKLELIIPEFVEAHEGHLSGQIALSSKFPQTVKRIKMAFIERYARGRGQEKRIDEYLLGETELTTPIEVAAESTVTIDFHLPFEVMESDMDRLQRQNIFARGIVGLMKRAEAVSSDFRLEAEAEVEGVALNPFDKKSIEVKF
jgi:hypothetical protein